MSHNNVSRSMTEFVAGHCAHGFLMTMGFALTALGAILSATLRPPSALTIGLLGFTMFVAGSVSVTGFPAAGGE